ncbi:DUF5689 domain-containing protein [Sphingobacterium lactis]|uniref:DUF5689 domain-containing protein n=1 Tax=Sphingobacterium lactis TaxID=797291 RepID=UPI003DA38140
MKQIGLLFFCLLSILFTSCEREYTPPPLTEPTYTGKFANTTIKQLRERYAKITSPELIADEVIIRGVVTGNDESGNIYKQIYLQDETGAINIGVDQNAIYGSYQVGQEVFVSLKDLYILKYGDELQIGLAKSQANRISWEVFKEKAQMNSWPKPQDLKPLPVTLDKLTDDMVHRLVEIKGVRFVNGGKNAFTTNDVTTNEEIKNKDGRILIVRSSNFSDFAKDILPQGEGSLYGILGRFNGTWQLILRTKRDVLEFDGKAPEVVPPSAGTFFKETFGGGTYPSGNRPKINDFKDFDMKAPVQYREDAQVADIRSISGGYGAHIWLPANRDATVRISGINTKDKGAVTLSYELTANLFDAGAKANLNQIQVKVNGVLMNVDSKEISNAAGDNGKFYKITIPAIPQGDNVVIEFVSSAALNQVGFRLDNIQLEGTAGKGGETIIVEKK